jgi:hypothetical protein
MKRIVTLSAALGASLFLSLAPANAQWSMSQRTKFLGDCIPSCEANPNVPPNVKGQCGMFCNCIANEGEKVTSSADFDEMDEAAKLGRDHPKTKQLYAAVPACNQRAFSGQ